MTTLIHIDDFEELALISCNLEIREIEPGEAFALYESNWRFVDTQRMSEKEKALVKQLTEDYGFGVINF